MPRLRLIPALLAAAVCMLAHLVLAQSLLAQPAPRPQQPRPAQPAQPQAGPSFTLRNEGTRPLREFYASSPDQNEWGSDRLGSDMVAAGQTYRIQLPRGTSCVQDLRAVFDDDTAEERRRVDVCRERTQAFRNPEPDTELELVNAMPRTIFQLFLRPPGGSDEWGPDRLGSTTVDAGGRETIRFTGQGNCSFDIRIVFDNDSAEERRNVNVCELRTVVFQPGWTTVDQLSAAPPTAPSARPRPGGAPPAARPSPAGEGPIVRNTGQVPIVRLSIDPPGSPAGPDRLGDAVIGPGASLAVALPPGLCTGDLVAIFRDGRSERRPAVSLCGGAEISLP